MKQGRSRRGVAAALCRSSALAERAVAAVYFVALLANGNPFLAAITEFEYPATLERLQ